ncbi:Uma2 family endonuclease [Streptomyces silvensis]|uniref:Putative restriction endonuclease domain-containing protein n=1 Tax=Streptomyces silvensis TaxID=1765722 RepID=A0A0W7WWB6_9ACTN|nr:Uma2 family endonuclease [Streptomyces silvensis]KUF14791.1 hypothetical protein AT728_35460 [Streptomyces silvensis]
MRVGEFETIALHAARVAEGARVELLRGQLGVKTVPHGDRGCVLQWLTRTCLRQRPELWLDTLQGLVIESDRGGRARPDGSLAPADAFAGQGEWADPTPVLMVVEVTSCDSGSGTGHRDLVEKPRAYAETGIPVHLLIDRDACEVKVHSRPDGVRYERVCTLPFGREVTLPDPVGISLATRPLEAWAR